MSDYALTKKEQLESLESVDQQEILNFLKDPELIPGEHVVSIQIVEFEGRDILYGCYEMNYRQESNYISSGGIWHYVDIASIREELEISVING